MLKNFNKYCILKFICNYIKRENTRKWRLTRFTVETQCMIDNRAVIVKLQQFYLDRAELESKLTIQFEGDIKPLRIVDNEEEKLHDFFQKIFKKTPGALYQTKLHDIDEATFIPGNRDTLEERAVLFKQYHQNLEDWPCH